MYLYCLHFVVLLVFSFQITFYEDYYFSEYIMNILVSIVYSWKRRREREKLIGRQYWNERCRGGTETIVYFHNCMFYLKFIIANYWTQTCDV